MRRLANREWIAGGVLVIVGGFFLARNLVPGVEVFIPLVVGLAVLGLFFLIRSQGALVSGGVVTGIGVGVLVAAQANAFGGAGFLVSAGAGFLLVVILAAVFQVRPARFWPLVPGSLLVAAGALIHAAQLGPQVLALAQLYWPLILLIIGAYLLLVGRRAVAGDATDERSDRAGDDETTPLSAARRDRDDDAARDDRGRILGEAEGRRLGEDDRPAPLDRV